MHNDIDFLHYYDFKILHEINFNDHNYYYIDFIKKFIMDFQNFIHYFKYYNSFKLYKIKINILEIFFYYTL